MRIQCSNKSYAFNVATNHTHSNVAKKSYEFDVATKKQTVLIKVALTRMNSDQSVFRKVAQLLKQFSTNDETAEINKKFLVQTDELAKNVTKLSTDFLSSNKVPKIALDVSADCSDDQMQNLTLGPTDLTADARNRYTNCDDSDATRSAMDLLTKLIPSHFMESSEHRVRFLYIVTMAYTKMLKVVEEKLNASYVIFFKGGNIFKILLNEFKDDLRRNILRKILKQTSDISELSDFDFEILPTNDAAHCNLMQRHIQVLTFIVTREVKHFISRNAIDILPGLDLLNASKMGTSKHKLFIQHVENKLHLTQGWYHDVEVIGASTCFSDLKCWETDKLGQKDQEVSRHKLKLPSLALDRFKHIHTKGDRRHVVIDADTQQVLQRKDYVINACGDSVNVIQAQQFLDMYYKTQIDDLECDRMIENSRNSVRHLFGAMYCTHNRTIEASPRNHFQLNRIKLTILVAYKKIKGVASDDENPYYVDAIPLELLDVSHSFHVTASKEQMHEKYHVNLKRYSISFNNYKFEFFAQSLVGILKDYENVLFVDTNYEPWSDKKYTKRLRRWLWLCLIYTFASDFSYDSKLVMLFELKRAFELERSMRPRRSSRKKTKNCALGTQPQYHHPLQLRIQYVLQVISKNSAADATKSEDLLAFCKQGEASLKKMIQYMHDNFNKTTKIPVSDKLSLESLRLGRD